MDNNDPFVVCSNLVKIFKVGELEVVALQGLDIEVNKGEVLALVGPSGAGKTTLLNIIGGLDKPSAGKVIIADRDLLSMNENDRVIYKREVVGFAWQQTNRNLLPYLTASENIEMPMIIAGMRSKIRKERVNELLELIGLNDRRGFRPAQLSGGQQQRIALAIALANNPPLLLGDEITGQIDEQSSLQVFETLRKISEIYNTTIILVTHDPLVSSLVDRVVAIRDGKTSMEIRRHINQASGHMDEEEWVILDQVGRLQLPRSYLERLAMSDRVKVRMEDTHLSVWPDHKVRDFISLQGIHPEATTKIDYSWIKQVGPAVAMKNLWRTFKTNVEEIHAIRDINLVIPSGKLIVVKGPSGSGKTTLLNLIAGLDEPTSGDIAVGGRRLSEKSQQEIVEMRRRRIGFIFQTIGLLPYLTVEENVEIPLRLVGKSRSERMIIVEHVLKLVGMSQRAKHRTNEISGGEQQRVAIARALVNRPNLILADEPTGQLDMVTGKGIVDLMREIVDHTGITIIIASHDPNVWQAADIIYELNEGQLVP
jgi:peptide/nickel transport system ATP-binding protein